LRRVTIPKQHLKLMCIQGSGGFSLLRPPAESPPRQPLFAFPEPLAIVGQNLDRRCPSVAEDKNRAGEWVGLENLSAYSCQPINPKSEIDGLHGGQYAHLGRDLYHVPFLQKALLTAAKSTSPGFLKYNLTFAP
jgi:hypothetical protein